MGIARATRNLARTARANPIWALAGVLLAPFRFARHVFGALAFGGALFLALVVLLLLSIWLFGLDKNGPVALLALFGIVAGVLLVTAKLFVLPLLLNFDYDDRADTHGSARFASDREVKPLARAAAGLLIGRDLNTGKPLRYAGPSHLLTIAPTRTGP